MNSNHLSNHLMFVLNLKISQTCFVPSYIPIRMPASSNLVYELQIIAMYSVWLHIQPFFVSRRTRFHKEPFQNNSPLKPNWLYITPPWFYEEPVETFSSYSVFHFFPYFPVLALCFEHLLLLFTCKTRHSICL